MVVVDGKTRLQARRPLGPHIDGKVERLAIVLVEEVLHRRVLRMLGRAPVSQLRGVVQTQTSGGYRAAEGEANVMNWKNAAIVFEKEQKRPARGGFEPVAVMVSVVVIP